MNNQRLSKGSEESAPREVCSGDIVQFGVDVMENSRKGIYTEFKPIIKTEEIQIIGVLILGSLNLFSYSWLYCSHCEAVFT